MEIIVPGIYLLWGLGHRAPKGHVWHAPSGMRITTSHDAHGLPFARSRAILLYLATRAVEYGPKFTRQLTDIADMFQLSWPAPNIEKHLLRVLNAEYACTPDACACKPLPCRSQHSVAYHAQYNSDARRFKVTLSDAFVLTVHLGMRCSRSQVAELLRTDQLAALDLFIWYRWQEHRHKAVNVDALGAHGPFQLIKSSSSPTRKRDEIVRLHSIVASVWTDCRYSVSADGNRLFYANPSQAPVLAGTGCLFDIIFDPPSSQTGSDNMLLPAD